MTRSINGFRVSWVNQWQRVLAEHVTVPDCAYQFLISDWKFERCETVPHDDADRDATEGPGRFEKEAGKAVEEFLRLEGRRAEANKRLRPR
jgi:hypothetical protein